MSRAAYYGLKGRYSKGIMSCNEAIKLQPRSVRAYLYRFVAYQNTFVNFYWFTAIKTVCCDILKHEKKALMSELRQYDIQHCMI